MKMILVQETKTSDMKLNNDVDEYIKRLPTKTGFKLFT